MNILFCGGSPKSGSWAMRGKQIADAGGWTAANIPTDEQIEWADICVVVKRFDEALIRRLNGKKTVYDILDFWPQNENAPKDLPQAVMLAKKHISKIQPQALICANKQMAADLSGCAPIVTHIYHHCRLSAKPSRGSKYIYYDGYDKYLTPWLNDIKKAAERNSYQLRIGIPEQGTAALISCRDQWLSMRWKSNVKAANAAAYGVPLISRRENGVLETEPDSLFYDDSDGLHEAIAKIKNANPASNLITVEDTAIDYADLFDLL